MRIFHNLLFHVWDNCDRNIGAVGEKLSAWCNIWQQLWGWTDEQDSCMEVLLSWFCMCYATSITESAFGILDVWFFLILESEFVRGWEDMMTKGICSWVYGKASSSLLAMLFVIAFLFYPGISIFSGAWLSGGSFQAGKAAKFWEVLILVQLVACCAHPAFHLSARWFLLVVLQLRLSVPWEVNEVCKVSWQVESLPFSACKSSPKEFVPWVVLLHW